MSIKIIALKGRGGIGKTSTIVQLTDELVKLGYECLWRDVLWNKVDIVSLFKDSKGNLIGVASAGDNYNEVHSALKKLKPDNPIKIICACRTRDMPNSERVIKGTHKAMRDFSQNITFINKTIVERNDENKQRRANKEDINSMLNELNR